MLLNPEQYLQSQLYEINLPYSKTAFDNNIGTLRKQVDQLIDSSDNPKLKMYGVEIKLCQKLNESLQVIDITVAQKTNTFLVAFSSLLDGQQISLLQMDSELQINEKTVVILS